MESKYHQLEGLHHPPVLDPGTVANGAGLLQFGGAGAGEECVMRPGRAEKGAVQAR